MKNISTPFSFIFLLLLVSNKLSSQCYDLQNLYLRFDDGVGNVLSDQQDQHSGKLYNNPNWVVRSEGTAVKFNGLTQYASINSSSDFNWKADGSFSIELWCRLTKANDTYKILIGRDEPGIGTTHWWMGIEDTTGFPVLFLYNENGKGHSLKGKTKLNDGNWHHFATVRNALDTTTRIYVDGIQEDSLVFKFNGDFTSGSAIDIANLYINNTHSFLFEGEIDEVAIYSSALTTDELKFHYTRILDGEGYCGSEYVLPKITSKPEEYIRKGQVFTYNVKAEGIPRPKFYLSQSPNGMEINANTGEIKWVANETGIKYVDVLVVNDGGNDKQNFSLNVVDPCVDGLVSHNSFEDGAGIAPNNEIPYHKATLYNGPLWTDGAIGKAIEFNGTNQYMRISNHADFNWPQDGSFSIELLCKYNSVKTKHQIMLGRDEPAQLHWWLGAESNTGKIVFYLFNEGLKAKSFTNNNQWHHVSVVRDGLTNMTSLFVNGIKEDSLVYDYERDYTASSEICIASLFYNDLNSFFYQGCLDEISIYEKALNNKEVTEHYMKFLEGFNHCEILRIKPTISSTPVTVTQVRVNYTYQVEAEGVPDPDFKLLKAPKGMEISSSGLLSWIPDTAGQYPIEIKVSNFVSDTVQSYVLSVVETCIDGMISYYRFDEGIGVKPKNEVPYHNASIFYKPLWTDGWIGSALNFKDANNVMVISSHTDFNWEIKGSFSIELLCKINPDKNGTRVMIGRNQPDGPHWWLGFREGDFKPSFYIGENDITGTIYLNDGFWHHLVVVRDGVKGTTSMFIDGVLNVQSSYEVVRTLKGNSGVNVGCLLSDDEYKYLYDGKLDELAIYNRALSAEEVSDHSNLVKYKNGYCEYPVLAPSITQLIINTETLEAKK